MITKNNFLLYDCLYSDKEIDKILSDKVFIENIIKTELMLTKANSEFNFIPRKAFISINKSFKKFSKKSIDFKKNLNQSSVISLEILKHLRSYITDEYKRYIHYGATSQDIQDTALILQLKKCKPILLNRLKKVSTQIAKLIKDHKDTLIVGRTRKTSATVTTFGLKACNWLVPLLKNTSRLNDIYSNGLLSIQLGGPVGNLALYDKKGLLVRKRLSKLLGLNYSPFTWHNQRDNLIEFSNILSLITGAIGKVAKDILIMSQTEINEISIEKSGKSSSMPHKNNPVIAELLVAIANLNSSNISIMHNSLMHENERDGASWMMEWETLVRMIKLSCSSLNHIYNCLNSIKINKKKMKYNLDQTYGLAMSDYYFNIMLEFYSYDELKSKFSKFINKSIKQKRHLAYIIYEEMGKRFNIKKHLDYKNSLGINNNIVQSTLKEYKKTF